MNKKILLVSLISVAFLFGCGSTKQNTTSAPATETPATQTPATEAPSTAAPTTEAKTEAPATEVPTTEAPTENPTEVPTEAPTEEPTSEATEEPSTEAEKTEAEILAEEYGEFSVTAAEGSEYTLADGLLTLNTAKGEYTIQGFFQGKVYVPEAVAGKVTVYLNNACVYNPTDSAVYFESTAKNIELNSVEGTTNEIIAGTTDGDAVVAVKSENNIQLHGTGTLYVEARSSHAFSGSDIEVKSPTVHVSSVGDNFHGKSFTMIAGVIDSTAAADVFDMDLNSKEKKGTVTIVNASITADHCDTVMNLEGTFGLGVSYEDDVTYEVNEGEPISIVATNVLNETPVTVASEPTINAIATFTINGENYVYTAPQVA